MLQKILESYKGLPKSIYIIFFADIVNSSGNFVMPFLTIFLTDRIGLNEAEAGFYVMLAATAFVPGALIGGKIADILGRKRVIIVFHGIAGLFFIPCAFIEPSLLVVKLLILSSFFNGAARPAYGAMTTDLSTPENRKSIFSLLYLGHNIGFAVGPMVAGLLYKNHLSWLFLGDAITIILSLVMISVFVSETNPDSDEIVKVSETNSNERAEQGSVGRALLQKPVLVGFIVIVMIYSYVYAQSGFSLPLQLNALFGQDGPKTFGILLGTNAITVIALTSVINYFTQNIRPMISVSIGGVMYALGFGMVYFISSFPLFIISVVIWTIGEILTATNTGVYLANNTPITHRGRFNAVVNLITHSGHSLAPWLTGMYLVSNSIRSVWQICFVISLISVFLLISLNYYEQNRVINTTEASPNGI